jgi:hypothetical protein
MVGEKQVNGSSINSVNINKDLFNSPANNNLQNSPARIITPLKNSTENKPQGQNMSAYHSGKDLRFLEPEIVEKKNWELKNAGFAIILGFVLVVIQFGSMTLLGLEPISSWILAFVLIVVFGIAIYFLMEPTIEKEIRQKIIETNLQTIDRPVVKEVIKEVIKTVEVDRPVYKEINIVKEVPVYREPKTVYIAKEDEEIVTRRSPQVRYDFVGSKIQKVYHKSTCRLGKSIDKKYLVKSPTKTFFRNLRYLPCKVCTPNK